jgi:hypothetical protein
MRKLLLSMLLLGASLASHATCAKTTVADTVYYATGDVLNGTIKVTNPMTITGADGCVVPANTVQTINVIGGALSIALIPNAGANPSGTYYKAEYHVSSAVATETWIVPSGGGPVGLATVRSLSPPVPTAMISASQLTAPSPCSPSQFFQWNGSSWGCAAVTAGVASFNGRNGAVVPTAGDYTASQVTNAESTANKDAASGYAGLDGSSKLTGSQQVYGTIANTAAQGNDARITGAEQAANKDAASGYAGLDSGTKLKCSEMPALTGGVTAAGGTCATTLSNVNLASQVTGVLPPANGGTQAYPYFYSWCFLPCGVNGSQNSSIGVANRLWVFQMVVPAAMTISKVTVRIVTGSAASVNDVGLYDTNKNLVANTGGFSTAAALTTDTVNLAQGTVSLPAGTYYFGMCASDTTSTLLKSSVAADVIFNSAGRVGIAGNSCTAGVLPSTIGTITVGSNAAVNTAVFE